MSDEQPDDKPQRTNLSIAAETLTEMFDRTYVIKIDANAPEWLRKLMDKGMLDEQSPAT
jgi:hypothetical protein